MNKIKVAYLIDTIASSTAGTERQLIETIGRLNRVRFEPLLICLYKSSWMESNSLPCETVTLEYKGFIKPNFTRIIRQLGDVIRQEGVQLLQTFFEDSIFVGLLAASLSGAHPLLLSSRRDVGMGKGRPWYHALFKSMLPLANKGFDGIVCNSSNVKEFVAAKERISKDRIKVIANGVNVPACLEPEPDLFRRFQSNLWIGIVANLKAVKRIDVFLKALNILRGAPSAAGLRGAIIGDGPERSRLMDLSEDLGLASCVHFMGSVENVTPYVQRLDIGVLCSDREGLSNAILEYMACGLPVVATSVGGNPELVDESNGFCIPAGDPAALARALERLAGDEELRKLKGRHSLEKVVGSYSWERSVRELEAYYEALLYVSYEMQPGGPKGCYSSASRGRDSFSLERKRI